MAQFISERVIQIGSEWVAHFESESVVQFGPEYAGNRQLKKLVAISDWTSSLPGGQAQRACQVVGLWRSGTTQHCARYIRKVAEIRQ